MREIRFRLGGICLLAVILAMGATFAHAQGSTTTAPLTGTVTDTSGGVLPGATVTVTHNATHSNYEAVTDPNGRVTIPALPPGTYTVKISLTGFKTWESPDITVIAATPSTFKATLQVGNLEETVVVQGATEIVQTQTTTIATTLGSNQIASLPLVTRNAVDFMTHLPGVDTTGTIRSNTTVLGLNMNATNITIDGVNVQDNYLKSSDGFFAVVRPTLDSVEEVTMTMAAQDAASAGQGAVQMRFVTRSGTNRFTGSAYQTHREPAWNTPYYFNIRDLPHDPVTGKPFVDRVFVNKWGFREGGPIVIPGLFDGHDKAFFFFNWEKSWQPSTSARNRTVLNPAPMSGIFQYNSSAGVRQVDLMALAAKYGQVATMDPTVGQLLLDIQQATTTTGGFTQLSDPNLKRYTFSNSMNDNFGGPTVRIDYNVTQKHRVGGSLYVQKYIRDRDMLNSYDPQFPGFPVSGKMTRTNTVLSLNLRSTLSSNMVNEGKFGYTGGATGFAMDVSSGMFSDSAVDQGGYALSFGAAGITSPYGINFNERRGAPVWSIEDTLNWIRGSHSISMGGTLTNVKLDLMDVNRVVPQISFGLDSTDPAQVMFTSANFPSATSTDLSNAKGIYALLTGRVTGINGDAYLNSQTLKYTYNGPLDQDALMREFGIFVQDSWRLRPYMTLTGGVRYEVQLPFNPISPTFSTPSSPDDLFGISGPGNLFKPGVMTGKTPTFVQYTKGTPAYKTDWNNIAPSVGVAFRPTVQGKLKAILGADPVFRAGYSLSYMREGSARFTSMFSYNPGPAINASRNMTVGNLVTGTGSDVLPLLFRDRGRLGAPAFQQTPNFPLTGAVTDQLNVFDPSITVPYAHSYSFGFQRALNKNTALEIRYVGTRSRDGWAYNNWNEVNVLENNFLNEFKQAMQNLQANIAAGRGNNFKYYGPGTNTYPLPIYLAYFSGVPASQANDPAQYNKSTLWSNSNFYNPLNPVNPNPYTPASSSSSSGLYGDATRRQNALNAGVYRNLFVVNPDLLGGVYKTYNRNFTRYDSVQFLVRRRMAAGLLLEGSYTGARGYRSQWYTLREDPEEVRNTGVPQHVFKINWVYELPFGQGKHWGSGVSRGWNRLVGGWSFGGGGRVQSGTIADLGNVRLVGMTDADLKNIYKLRFEFDPSVNKTLIYMWPADVIDNSIKAYSYNQSGYTKGAPTGRYFAPANGPDCVQAIAGDCAPRHHWVTGPMFTRFDMTLAKRIDITSKVNIELRVDALNVFNNVNFYQNSTTLSTQKSSYEVTSAYKDINNTQDAGGRLLQLVSRISW